MKLWTRAIMAILLAALAISYLVTVPAEAAKTETVVTYGGYTLSWSKPDASEDESRNVVYELSCWSACRS